MGRGVERARLQAALAGAVAGRGSVVLVSGDARVIAVIFLPPRREQLARLTGVRIRGDRGGAALVSTHRRRFERCRQDLRHPVLQAEPASTIAACWGLTSAAHFGRAFRAEYGVSPLEYRRSALHASGRRA